MEDTLFAGCVFSILRLFFYLVLVIRDPNAASSRALNFFSTACVVPHRTRSEQPKVSMVTARAMNERDI